MAKRIHTAIEPTTAPVSGRTRSRRNGLTRSIRSPVITLIFPSFGNVGAGFVAARLEAGGKSPGLSRHKRLPYTTLLAGPRRRQLDHPAHVTRVDEARTGLEDTVRDRIEIRLVQRQQNDGQISLEILLLVNSEQHLVSLDRI